MPTFLSKSKMSGWWKTPSLITIIFRKKNVPAFVLSIQNAITLVFARVLAPAVYTSGCHPLWSPLAQSFHLPGPICLPEM